MNDDVQAEYGSVGNIRFPSLADSCMKDSNGNPVKCKCGNPAGMAIMGQESYIARCGDCVISDKQSTSFIYQPQNQGEPIAQNATVGVKFSNRQVILDRWWLFGGTRWTRSLFRLKHPFVYSKRGLLNIWRRIKRVFVKEEITPCITMTNAEKWDKMKQAMEKNK